MQLSFLWRLNRQIFWRRIMSRRLYLITIAIFLAAVLAMSGCEISPPTYEDSSYYSYYGGSGVYYSDFPSYRQAQWDRYNYERANMLERERLALQSERLQLERERLAWEKRELERLKHEQNLRIQWEREKAWHDQQRREQQQRDQQRLEQERREQQQKEQQRLDQQRREQQQRDQQRLEQERREQQQRDQQHQDQQRRGR